MGRYSSTPGLEQTEPFQNNEKNGYNYSSYDTSTKNTSVIPWPNIFPKGVIGVDRNVILEDIPILQIGDVRPLPGSLEAIKIMRLKGYRVIIFFNEPMISEGKATTASVDVTNTHLMKIFGQAGIMSIDGLYYSTSSLKEDIYAMPNNGMLKKAENEMKVNFKQGTFVGGKLYDLKVGYSAGAKPVLIKTTNFEETNLKLNTFANRELKNNVVVYNSLLDFSNSLN